MNLKKTGKVFTTKFVGTGPSSYKKENLPGRGLTKVEKHCFIWLPMCIYDNFSNNSSYNDRFFGQKL